MVQWCSLARCMRAVRPCMVAAISLLRQFSSRQMVTGKWPHNPPPIATPTARFKHFLISLDRCADLKY